MNEQNAFAQSWDFIATIVEYCGARYAAAGSKMSGSFNPAWNAHAFFAGFAEIIYLTAVIVFVAYLIFKGFSAHKGIHSAALVFLVALAIVTCIG